MTIRRLLIAALLASASAAHADTISTPSSSANFVSGWTAGNGTDVLGSGVLQGNLNLVGGVAHGTGSSANLTDVLYGKVAGTIGQVDGQTTLFYQRGIEASYLLASGHGILAATLGPGKSVVASAEGAIIKDGVGNAPGMVGGGNNSIVPGGAGGGNSQGGGAGGGSSGNGAQAGGSNPGLPGNIFIPDQANKPNDNGLVIPKLETPAAVPEPSSAALLLLGMMGAGALTRRRSR